MSLSNCPITAVAAVSDLARARGFYEGSLGLSLVDSEGDEQSVLYQCGNGTDLLIYVSAENAGSGSATVAFWETDDLESEMETLRRKGVGFEQYEGFDQDENGVMAMGDGRVAWFTDPDGNIFAIGD